jgi:hypothetical protein
VNSRIICYEGSKGSSAPSTVRLLSLGYRRTRTFVPVVLSGDAEALMELHVSLLVQVEETGKVGGRG